MICQYDRQIPRVFDIDNDNPWPDTAPSKPNLLKSLSKKNK